MVFERACAVGSRDWILSESLSWGDSCSASDNGVFLGLYSSPVNVNAPESWRNAVRAAVPLGVPSSSGRAISRFLSCRLPQWPV